MNKRSLISVKEIKGYCHTLIRKYAIGMEILEQNSINAITLCYRLLDKSDLKKLVDKINSSIEKKLGDKAGRFLVDDYLDEDEVATCFYKAFHKNKQIYKQYKNFVEEIFNKSDSTESTGFPNLDKLSDIYGLNKSESRLLELYCCVLIESSFEEYLDSMNMFENMIYISRMLGLPENEVMKMHDDSGKLIRAEILDKQHSGNYYIENEVAMYIVGCSELDSNISSAKAIDDKVFEVDSFNIKPIEKNILSNILTNGNGCRILFHGTPGTGKTELAKSIAKVTGKSSYYLDLVENDNPRSRFHAILSVKRKLKRGDILVIDEAENLLSTEFSLVKSIDKGQINGLLDDFSTMNTIWIVNYINHIDPSTLRRFDYNLDFKPLSNGQRKRFWQNALDTTDCTIELSEQDIEELSCKYPVDNGSISSTFKLLGLFKEENKKDVLNELLYRSLYFDSPKGSRDNLSKVNEFYDLSVVNTDCNVVDIVESTNRFLRKPGLNINGLKMLLHGIPGTGKTEFAKYLASKCGKSLVIRSLSDILSKWVGGTEQNIAKIFKEAESANSILLLDEADALFTSRATEMPSWEISKTNELLKQVENYKGVLICATNLIDTMDKASLRRFHWKIEFKALTSKSRIKLFKKYFPDNISEMTNQIKDEICQINELTPGSFSIVKQRLMLLDKAIPIIELVKEIKNEASYQNEQKKADSIAIGFSA